MGKYWILVCGVAVLLAGCRQDKSVRVSDDFDTLTGKQLPSWSYVQTKEDFAHLDLFKGIYNSLKGQLQAPDERARIPKSVHFIWLGPRPFPAESIENVRTWMAKHPDWTFNFWTDRPRPLPQPGLIVRRAQDFTFSALKGCFDQTESFAEKSDVLRYEILAQEGGVYVDHDVKCFQSFDTLNCAYDFYCGIDMPHTSMLPSSVFTTNNLIGVKPDHPIMHRCIQLLSSAWDQLETEYPGKDRDSTLSRVLHRTFWLFGQAVKLENNHEGNRDIVFPAYYFDAPKDELALFARHQYAGSWHQKETPFEKNVRERLMKITKKSNLTLLLVACVSILNLAGVGLLFWRLGRRA